jgi:cell division initiation protein
MKITPLEIRQKDFEKKLRGYDKDEVQAFLQSVSNEWERMLDESKELKMKLAHAEKEVQKLREVESSLYKTLKTAEDTGANLIEQSNKAAELHLRETQMNAEGMLNESKNKARAIIEKAEQEAKDIINEVQEGVKELDLNYKTIESHRDNLIKDLMNLANDLVERIQRTDKQKSEFKLQDQIKRVRDLARESERRIDEEHLDVKAKPIEPISIEKIQKEVADRKTKEIREMGDDRTPEIKVATEPKEKQTNQPFVKTGEPQNKEKQPEPVKDEPKPKAAPTSESSFFDLLDED